MKKHLLLFLCVLFVSKAFSQSEIVKSYLKKAQQLNIKPVPFTKPQAAAAVEMPVKSYKNQPQHLSKTQAIQAITEQHIGVTTYDLQTNAAIGNRLLVHNDSTISAAWTLIAVGGTSASRGTGYNYFNGSNWSPIPTQKIEPISRAGSNNILVTSSGREIAIAHTSTGSGGILLTARPAKGIGAWIEDPTVLGQMANDTWARAIVGGTNGETVHVICHGSGNSATPVNGQDGPLLYSRSLDGGITFPVLRSIIPAIDSSHYLGFSADSYSIDTKGDTVAIVVGGLTTDLILLKSIDNGTTWNSSILQSFPIPFYNGSVGLPGGSAIGPSGDAHVMIDKNGLVHVFWSNLLLTEDSSGSLGYYPNVLDGLLYWNENHALGAVDTIATAPDKNGNGQLDVVSNSSGCGIAGNYRGSITQMPSSAVDSANNLFVSFQSICEDCDTLAYAVNHKHVFTIVSQDNGITWSNPLDINQNIDSAYQEGVYACLAKNANGAIHLIYQRDPAPGHSLLTNGLTQCQNWNLTESDIIYTKIDYSGPGGFPWRYGNLSAKAQFKSNLNLQNFPNPADKQTVISFELNQNSTVKLELRNILGQIKMQENLGKIEIGKHTLPIVTTSLPSGLYFYSLKTEHMEVSDKMLIIH